MAAAVDRRTSAALAGPRVTADAAARPGIDDARPQPKLRWGLVRWRGYTTALRSARNSAAFFAPFWQTTDM